MYNLHLQFSFAKYIYFCGQSYKASAIIIYDTKVVPDLKIPYITTLDS